MRQTNTPGATGPTPSSRPTRNKQSYLHRITGHRTPHDTPETTVTKGPRSGRRAPTSGPALEGHAQRPATVAVQDVNCVTGPRAG